MRRLVLIVLAATILAPLAASQAQSADQPARKPGWWEMRMVLDGPLQAHSTMRQCTDARVDEAFSPLGVDLKARGCPQPRAVRTATGWTLSGSCNVGYATIVANAVATGDFDDRYHVDIDLASDALPASPPVHGKMTLDAHRIGECPAGKKPGDAEVVEASKPVAGP